MNKQEIEKAINFFKYTLKVSLICGRRNGKEEFYKKSFEHFNTAIQCMEKQLTNGWIPVSEKLPENDNPVIVTAQRNDGARGYFIYKACYNAPQTHTTEDYGWDSEYIDSEYDEENDCFWVPECWFEDNAIEDNGNYMLDDEFDILAWQPLPEPWKEVSELEEVFNLR